MVKFIKLATGYYATLDVRSKNFLKAS